MSTLVSYIPSVIAAIVIILVGIVLGGFVGGLIGRRRARCTADARSRASDAAASLLLAIFMALQELGIATDIVTTAFAILFGAIALALALSFGLGNRELAGEITREWYDRYRRERAEALAREEQEEAKAEAELDAEEEQVRRAGRRFETPHGPSMPPARRRADAAGESAPTALFAVPVIVTLSLLTDNDLRASAIALPFAVFSGRFQSLGMSPFSRVAACIFAARNATRRPLARQPPQ